jgi:hypothetical protein
MMEYNGTKYICDGCGVEQIIIVHNNAPVDWSRGELSMSYGVVGPEIDLCPDCWPPNWQNEHKIPTLVKLFNCLRTKRPVAREKGE